MTSTINRDKSQITLDAFIDAVRDNPQQFRLIDIIFLIRTENYQHLASEILHLKFSDLVKTSTLIHEQTECEKEIIKNYGKIINLGIADIQKEIGHCDRLILAKAIKLLEQKNSYGYRMVFVGKRKGRKYTLLREAEYIEKYSGQIVNEDEDDDEDDELI